VIQKGPTQRRGVFCGHRLLRWQQQHHACSAPTHTFFFWAILDLSQFPRPPNDKTCGNDMTVESDTKHKVMRMKNYHAGAQNFEKWPCGRLLEPSNCRHPISARIGITHQPHKSSCNLLTTQRSTPSFGEYL
jgi:hypothetical protein